MNKVFLMAIAVVFSMVGNLCAGEVRTLPDGKYIYFDVTPSNEYEMIQVVLDYASGNIPYRANVIFNILDAEGGVHERATLVFQNATDDPETEDIDETSTAFSDFISGIGATINNRSDTAAVAYIEANYDVRDNE